MNGTKLIRKKIAEEYESCRKELTQIKNFEFLRNFFSSIPTENCLYVLFDSSLQRICAVAFFLASQLDDTKNVSFVFGKTKAAPKKTKHILFGIVTSSDNHKKQYTEYI